MRGRIQRILLDMDRGVDVQDSYCDIQDGGRVEYISPADNLMGQEYSLHLRVLDMVAPLVLNHLDQQVYCTIYILSYILHVQYYYYTSISTTLLYKI